MEILKRAKEFQSGEGVSAFESEDSIREEVNYRTWKAGYTDKDGQPRNSAGKDDSPRPVNTDVYNTNYERIFGHT